MSADLTERVARALSRHWRDMHTNEALGYQRMLAAAALAAVADAPGLEEVLRVHAEVGDYFTAEAGWVNYGCLCGRVFGQESEHSAHLEAVVRAWLRGECT